MKFTFSFCYNAYTENHKNEKNYNIDVMNTHDKQYIHNYLKKLLHKTRKR